MARPIFVEILASTKQFTGELEKAVASTSSANSSFHRMGKAAGLAGLALTGVLAVGIDKAAKAAMAAQTSTARLDAAFKTAHLSAGQFAGGIDLAESSARKLGFENKDVRESLGSLVVATKSGSAALKDLGVAEDVARFKHIGLTDASKTLTMAMAGSQRAAHQLGIIVMPVTTHLDALKASHVNLKTASGHLLEAHAKLLDKMATGNAVIAEVSAKLHGQAEAFSQTAAGGMEQFHAQIGNLEEKLGSGLLPILSKLADMLSTVADYFSKHTTLAKVFAIALGGVAVAMLAVSVATNLANLAFLASPVGAVIAGLVLLGVGIYELIKHWDAVKSAMSNLWDWVENTFLTAWHDTLGAIQTVYHWLEKNWPLVLGIITGPIGLAVVEIQQHWNDIENAVHDTFNRIKNWFTDWGGRVAHWFAGLPGMIGDAISGAIGDLENMIKSLFSWHKIVGWIKDALGFHSPSPHFVAIGTAMIESIVHGVGQSAGLLKDAVSRLASDWFGANQPGQAQGGKGSYGPRGPTGASSSSAGIPTAGGVDLVDLHPQVLEALHYAIGKGWHGEVTSGFRTYAQQNALYQRYLHGGPLAAPPGHSSHERGDAVDVTDYGVFGSIMKNAPSFERLYNHLPTDPVHYSVTGYDQGGLLMPGLTLALNQTGKPEMVIPHGKGGGEIVVHNVVTLDGQVIYENWKRHAGRDMKRNGGFTGVK